MRRSGIRQEGDRHHRCLECATARQELIRRDAIPASGNAAVVPGTVQGGPPRRFQNRISKPAFLHFLVHSMAPSRGRALPGSLSPVLCRTSLFVNVSLPQAVRTHRASLFITVSDRPSKSPVAESSAFITVLGRPSKSPAAAFSAFITVLHGPSKSPAAAFSAFINVLGRPSKSPAE